MSDSGSTGRTGSTYSLPFATSFPSSGNTDEGEHALRKGLQSVVMSRLAYRMCRYFHEQEDIEIDQEISDGCDALFSSVVELQANTRESAQTPVGSGLPPRSPSPSAAPAATTTAVTSPELAGEPQITRKLVENMGEFISVLDVAHRWHLSEDVSGERETSGRNEIIFVKKKPLKAASQEGKSEENERDVVALLEVGIQRSSVPSEFSFWTSKLGQASKYLKEMAKDGTTGPVNSNVKNVYGNPKFRGPALLGIVSFDKERTFMNVGVFCCEPLDRPDSFRMALMYREQVHGREQMTKAFANMVKGIVAFNSVRDLANDFTYLGPNCAKVMVDDQVTVFRAYDNRARRTPRSPHVYLEHLKAKDIMFFKDKEDGELTKFGTDPKAEKDEEYRKDWTQWLFSFHGQLRVISVPFVAGEHIPKTIGDLQHITHELRTLHKEGIKHGDLRLWNMVFAKDGAKLLDFDFSGSNVYYPDGYAQYLPDVGGMRPGKKHEEITEADDIEALLTIFSMFQLKGCRDDIELLGWWWITQWMVHKKLEKDSSEVLSWMIEQFEPHSEVRIEIQNPTARKMLQEEMNRSKTRKTTEVDTMSPEK